MKILVSGGAGFIASHIVDALLKENHEVVIIDNLVTGNITNINSAADFYEMNILDNKLKDIFLSFEPEVVIHHAAQIDVQASMKNPRLDAETNINGTIAILDLCRNHKVRKFIYASSAAVYGSPEYLPIDENHAKRPTSFYGISKYAPEHYVQTFANLNGFDYTIFRYANVFGDRQDVRGEGGVISLFIDMLLRNEQPKIYGDGEQTRDFIYVKDIVSANIAALTTGENKIFNISTGKSTSVNEMYNELCNLLKKNFKPVYVAPRDGDIMHSCLDNSFAIEELGWVPQFTFRDGLALTCEYYSNKGTI